jgi:hypothetical protein
VAQITILIRRKIAQNTQRLLFRFMWHNLQF